MVCEVWGGWPIEQIVAPETRHCFVKGEKRRDDLFGVQLIGRPWVLVGATEHGRRSLDWRVALPTSCRARMSA